LAYLEDVDHDCNNPNALRAPGTSSIVGQADFISSKENTRSFFSKALKYNLESLFNILW